MIVTFTARCPSCGHDATWTTSRGYNDGYDKQSIHIDCRGCGPELVAA